MNFAQNDENIEPDTNISEAIGRQVKRTRVADNLANFDIVSDQVVGERFKKGVELSLEAITGEEDSQQARLVAAVVTGIGHACLPGGAISNAISNACLPGGAISNAISNACLPGGVISNAIQRETEKTENRALSRNYNSKCMTRSARIAPLSNVQGDMPLRFPSTLGEFWNLNSAAVDQLRSHYGLPLIRNVSDKKMNLAQFLCLQMPID